MGTVLVGSIPAAIGSPAARLAVIAIKEKRHWLQFTVLSSAGVGEGRMSSHFELPR